MNLVLHPAADSEFAEAVAHYSEVSFELADRFVRHVTALVRQAWAYPKRFRIFDPPARRHFARGFPYAILYLDHSDRIWIVAVMHFKQRPGYWRERISERS